MAILECMTTILCLIHKVKTLKTMFFASHLFEFFVWNKLEIVETLKITHRNLLNDAASLKTVHESVEVKTYINT